MLTQAFNRTSAPFFIVILIFSIGCSDKPKDSGGSEALQTHLTQFNSSATKTSQNLANIVDLADAINRFLQAEDFESAAPLYDLFAAELSDLGTNVDALETAEAGIRDTNAISQYNLVGNQNTVAPQRAFFTVLAGTALFTYGTKSLMNWLKGKSDAAIAARKERDDAQDDIGNGVDGAEERYTAAKNKQKEIGIEVIDKLSKTVITTSATALASPATVAGMAIKEVSGKALEAGLDVLSATKACKGGSEAAGCVIGATKSTAVGKADVPAQKVDVVISGGTMARIEVLDVEAEEGKTVVIPKTEIKNATSTSVGAGTITADTDSVESDSDSVSDSAESGALCNDSCATAGDGECDDGGEGAMYMDCALGSDCSDCGARENVPALDPLCNDSCEFSGDGECDDGGEGASFTDCTLGSDCSDCGTRQGDSDTDSETSSAVACSGSGSAGVYPEGADGFNGLQVTYSIAGVCLDTPVESEGFTITRDYPVLGINGDNINISGSTAPNDASCNSDSGSFWFQTDVTLTVNGVTDTYSSPEPCVQDTTDAYSVGQPSYTFDLSVPMGSYGDSVSFSITQTYVNPLYGNRVVTVTGNTSY